MNKTAAQEPTTSQNNESDQHGSGSLTGSLTGNPTSGAKRLVASLQLEKQPENLLSEPQTQPIRDVHPYTSTQSQASMIAHGEKVAAALGEWGAGETLQAAGLLHSLVWNRLLSDEAVADACGNDVLFLCQTYRKRFAEMPSKEKQGRRWRGKQHMLQRVKYLLLAYEDFDLALLGAADLWCHFCATSLNENERGLSLRRQIEIVQQICKPYFEFLGLHESIEAFNEWLFSLQAQNSKKRAKKKRRSNASADSKENEVDPITDDVTKAFAATLPQANLRHSFFLHLQNSASESTTEVGSASPARNSSKPQQAINISQTHNINIVVDTVEQCYQALGLIHQRYAPVDGATHDHLSNSRLNGYRMLQTAAIAPVQVGESEKNIQRVRVHFHICTRAMDAVNRWGLAAIHLQTRPETKLDNTRLDNTRLDKSGLANVWWRSAVEQFEQIRGKELGSLPETLHVLSPQGQLFDFHVGCTVVDYAYRVHSRLADQCRRFTVNGEAVEPATVLHHLDLVELQYDPYTSGPTRVWYNAAHTPRARSAISKFLRNHRQDIYLGQQKLDQELKRLQEHYAFHIPQHLVEQALTKSVQKMGFASVNDLLGDIAASKVQPLQVLRKLFEQEIVRQIEIPPMLNLRPHLVYVMQCCRPRLGEEIVGLPEKRGEVITRLKIHTSACENVASNVQSAESLVPLKWRMRPEQQEVTRVVMRAQDDRGLLGDAIQQIYELSESVTLHKSEAVARYGIAQLSFIVETESREVLDGLVDALRRLPDRDIIEVQHMNLSLTEREEFAHLITSNPAAIPYTRAPVHEEGRFFGRRTEIERITDLLRSHEDVVWVRGHKRVGKTSLLRHLKNTRLDRNEFLPVFYDFQQLSDLSTETICFELACAVYDELQDNAPSAREVGAPLRGLFQREPIKRFIRYLRSAQEHAGTGRIVLLIDEFSRTTDTYHQALKSGAVQPDKLPIDPQFFYQWRGMIQEQKLDVCFVIVVQQQAYDNMRDWVDEGKDDPSWQLMELGEQLELRPFSAKDAHELIGRPMRNYLDLSPELVDQIYHLTGGGPFLIQAFCSKLVTRMSQLDRKQVTVDDVQHVVMEFMSPNESIFAHLLDLTRNVASTIADRLALMLDERMLDEQAQVDPTLAHLVYVQQDTLKAALPDVRAEQFHNMLNGMHERDILIKEGPDSWRFASGLFQQWLALNQWTR